MSSIASAKRNGTELGVSSLRPLFLFFFFREVFPTMKYTVMLEVVALLALFTSGNALVTPAFCATVTRASTHLSMGLLDSIFSFLQDREGDFVKLEDSDEVFGPGPLLLLYNLNLPGIGDDEYVDMVKDGAPKACKGGVIITRISIKDATVLDMSISDALELIVRDKGVAASSGEVAIETEKCPVLFFSGFHTDEMMATYNIIGKEIYDESGGSLTPACAMAVKRAMAKPLRQVLDEIAGDHQDAMSYE